MKPSIIAISSLPLLCSTPTQKLHDIAVAKGGSVQNSITLEYESANIRRLVEQSDVIVQGIVRSVTPHLDPGEEFVVTDCEVDAGRFFKQRVPVAFAARPAHTAKLVVQHPGGTVVDGQYRLTTLAYQYKTKDEFRPGEEMILFLVLNKEAGVFDLSSGPFGAFRIRNGAVEALTPEAAKERGDRPRWQVDFISELQQALASSR
jgi:hypothetical protein